MSKLIIIRGLTGSGKTYFAKTFNCFHVEADMYFIADGEYKFVPERVRKAHAWCEEEVLRAVHRGLDVVVSNTFIRVWEMQAYLDMPGEITVYKCLGDYGSIHKIPYEVIHKMRNRWEDYEGEITV